MQNVMNNVLPVILLMLFGIFLQKRRLLSDEVVQGIMRLVSQYLVPCILFTTFFNLDFKPEYFGLAACIFLIQLLLMGAGFLVVKFFHYKRRFGALYACAFAFGFMAIPLFSTVYGVENMGYLTSMGVGHELFIGLVFMPVARLYLKNEKMTPAQVGKNFMSPLFIMILLAFLIRGLGLKEVLEANVLGRGLIDTVSKLGSISSTLILVMVGYKIRLNSLAKIGESILLVAVRYVLIFAIGYGVKVLWMDPMVGNDFYFDAGFFILISQHGSVVLNAYIGEYGTKEDSEIASNAFAINAIIGVILFVAYVYIKAF